MKISGKKVNQKGTPREGAFQPSKGTSITLRSSLWSAYQGRNRNSVKKELHEGNIIWLEPMEKSGIIKKEDDVKSIQWARWGRKGRKLTDAIPKG